MENYSLSDLAAVTNGNGGVFGGSGNGAWLIIILLFFLMGGGAWGNRGGDYGQYATAASQQEILFNQHFNNLDNKMDRGFTSIGNGISDATYALNNAITGEGRNMQMQLANHNCDMQRNVDALRYDMANFNAGILAAIGADGEKTRAMIQQNKIETLQGRINQLELQSAMCGVVRYPNGMTYNAGASPFCNCGTGCCA